MRYSVLGFNQEAVMQTNLDITDLMILQYIQQACGSPSMTHIITEEEHSLVWISHAKFHEDLPILNMTEGTFKNRLTQLKKEGFIESTTIKRVNGSCAFYAITDKTENLLYTHENAENNARHSEVTSARHSKMTSNNTLNDNKLKKLSLSKDKDSSAEHADTDIQSETKTQKPKKASLWDKCVSMISEFTDDEILKGFLTESLKIFLENARESGSTFFSNTFKGKLNALKRLSEDNYEQRKIVQQTLDKGWNNFYAIQQNTQKRGKVKDFARDVEHMDSRTERANKEDMKIYETY